MKHHPKLKSFVDQLIAYKQPIIGLLAVAVTLFLVSLIPLTPLLNVFETLNPFMWVLSNLLIVYIGLVLIVFAASYYLLFNPKLTTGGYYIFRFVISLVGIIGLVFIGIFLNPTSGSSWMEYPGDLLWWRPTVRTIVYGYIGYTTTGLARLLYLRKFKPEKLRTAADLNLVRPRRESS